MINDESTIEYNITILIMLCIKYLNGVPKTGNLMLARWSY